MRQRTSKLTSNATARQPAVGHQLNSQQVAQNYGSPQQPQVSWGSVTQGYTQPKQMQPNQGRPGVVNMPQRGQPYVEQPDGLMTMNGAPNGMPIVRGKIQMKDAITLITLRLAKLEELTSSSGFQSSVDEDGLTGEMSSEMIDNINERLTNLENGVAELTQANVDINKRLDIMNTSIHTLIELTTIEQDEYIKNEVDEPRPPELSIQYTDNEEYDDDEEEV
jgi:hypothetical protein